MSNLGPSNGGDDLSHPLPGTPGSGRRSIAVRAAVLSWAVIFVAVVLFVVFIIPRQEAIYRAGLESTAAVVATSAAQITVSSIVVEEYSPVIEHCLKVVGERPNVLYLVITRRGGFSLIHTANNWRYRDLGKAWQPESAPLTEFEESELVGEQVFHYAYPLSYSGIDWGWIHVGLSLEQFTADVRAMYIWTIAIGLLCLLVVSPLSVFFARRLSRPILRLSHTMARVAAGDLKARARISTGDEVESLAHSFNQMTEALGKSHEELEARVQERTAELREANEALLAQIRERQRAEEARESAESELEEQRTLRLRSDRLRSLGEMAAGIAHELNQPLTGVRGLAELHLTCMEHGWEVGEKVLRERLDSIIEQSDRMVHIIDHVRHFARDAGKAEREEVQVNEVVRSATDLIGVQFRSHGVHIVTDLATDLPPVWINPFSLEEVLINLLTNARDAVEGRGEGQVVLCTRQERDSVLVEVRDNGGGIPEHILGRVFEPFFTTKDLDRGTGLGLPISRSIVEGSSGRLGIASTPGSGATATISLPAMAPEDGAGERPAPSHGEKR